MGDFVPAVGLAVSAPDPAARLAAELPSDGSREVLVRLEQARRRHERAVIAEIGVDENGVVHLEVRRRFSRLREQLSEQLEYEKQLLAKLDEKSAKEALTRKP